MSLHSHASRIPAARVCCACEPSNISSLWSHESSDVARSLFTIMTTHSMSICEGRGSSAAQPVSSSAVTIDSHNSFAPTIVQVINKLLFIYQISVMVQPFLITIDWPACKQAWRWAFRSQVWFWSFDKPFLRISAGFMMAGT